MNKGDASSHDSINDTKPDPFKTYAVNMESTFVYVVAALLAGASGALDAIAFIMFGCFIANQSGNVIQVGMRSADETAGDPMMAAQLVGSFILGCTICGMLIPRHKTKFPVGDDLYTIALFFQATFLVFTMLTKTTDLGKYFGCIACGLMNSITTSWSDGPMRTTHATGPSTEVGLNLGRMISLLMCSDFDERSKVDLKESLQKFRLNFVLVLSFAVGGYAGSVLYSQFGGDALILPILISIGVAILNLAIPAVAVEPERPPRTWTVSWTEPLLSEASPHCSRFSAVRSPSEVSTQCPSEVDKNDLEKQHGFSAQDGESEDLNDME